MLIGIGGMQYTGTPGGGGQYNFEGKESKEWSDNLFNDCINSDSLMRALAFEADIYYRMYRLHQNGQIKGYEFLFTMPVEAGMLWLRKALYDYIRQRRIDPEAFPVDGIQACLDRLRAWRKTKNKKQKTTSTSGVSKLELK